MNEEQNNQEILSQLEQDVIESFKRISENDVQLFLAKTKERGTEFLSNGIVGIYFSLKEVFIRIHMLVYEKVKKGEQMEWSKEEIEALHNLLQDNRVFAALGEICLERRNWAGDGKFLKAIFGKEFEHDD